MKEYYSPSDFIKSPKYNAHIHYHTFDDLFLRKAKRINMSLLTINTDLNLLPIDTQFEVSQSLHERHPESFNYLCTFDSTAFASEEFAENTIKHIKNCMEAGAKGVKIWKNIGMLLKNERGEYVMADDPVFAPIFAFLEKEKIPLMAHLGEPRNCWLPLESITTYSDMRYFSKNPLYHAYLNPEMPSYERQMMAQDQILERYPELIYIGAHLGSKEWNLEEVAKMFDRFPNFCVDLTGRFDHIFEQTLRDKNQVINFFEKYHNRIMYGTDCVVSVNTRWGWLNLFSRQLPKVCMNLLFEYSYSVVKRHWLFLATDKVIKTGRITNKPDSPKQIQGLKLSKNVVDDIFYNNAIYIYKKWKCQS